MSTTARRGATALLLATSAATLALLAGCGTSHDTAGPAPSADNPTVAAAPSTAPTEGPASTGHTWPDGFTVHIAGLKRMDPALAWHLAPTSTLVKLTVTFTNSGPVAAPLPSGIFLWRVLTGPNRMPAQDVEGDQVSGPTLTSDVPEQVAAGQSVTVFDSWDVPTADLSVLAVRVDLGGDRTPFTFTSAQTLLA